MDWPLLRYYEVTMLFNAMGLRLARSRCLFRQQCLLMFLAQDASMHPFLHYQGYGRYLALYGTTWEKTGSKRLGGSFGFFCD